MHASRAGTGGTKDAGLGGSNLGGFAQGGSVGTGGKNSGDAASDSSVGDTHAAGGLADGGSGAVAGSASGGAAGSGGLGGSDGLAAGGITVGPSAGGQSGATVPMGGSGGRAVGGSGGTPTGGGGGQNAGGAIAGAGGSRGFGGAGGFAVGGTPGYGTLGDRPADWTPPFVAPVGTTGWQQSSSPICDRNLQGLDEGFDVWADERGVFALIADSHDGGTFPPTSVSETVVQFNSGSGWQLYYAFPANQTSSASLLGGFRGGRLIVADTRQDVLAFLDQDGPVTQMPISYPFGAFVVRGDVAGNEVAYVASRGVFKYAAGNWSTIAEAEEVHSVWTDGETVIAVGWDQTILMGPADGPLTPVKGVPAGDYYAVWGFSAKDLWFGSSGPQLLHFDGSKWQLHETGSLSYGGIQQLWGDAGILYFSTPTEFGRWDGAHAELLLKPAAGTDSNLSKGKLGRFWGRSAKEVFIPVRDSRYEDYTCGTAFMLWFDGDQFHSF